MDALILSCGTGGGHNTAGRAVQQELTVRGHNAVFLDPFTLRGARTSSNVNNVYISVAQKAPRAFGFAYALGSAYRRLPVMSPVYYANRAMVPFLEKYLDENPCDAIVTTHLFPAEILTNMKARGMTVPPVTFIATDYTCIPFTEETDCDSYIIPSPELTGEFVSRGISREKIAPLGIPVRREFREPADRREARAGLGLAPDMPTILVAGGSIGAGSLDVTVGTLLDHFDDARVIVVCGSNRTLYERLTKKYAGKCTLLGYTSRMADYMRACDILISKPGGLSSTEAANLGTALVHVAPIPGCETRNMDFFSARGMSIPVRNPRRELADACGKLLNEPARITMRDRQRKYIPQTAAREICNLLEAAHLSPAAPKSAD